MLLNMERTSMSSPSCIELQDINTCEIQDQEEQEQEQRSVGCLAYLKQFWNSIVEERDWVYDLDSETRQYYCE